MPPAARKSKPKVEVVPSREDAALALFHPITAKWFRAVFDGPTAPQVEGWPRNCPGRVDADPRAYGYG